MPPRAKKSVHERSNNTTTSSHGLVPPGKRVTKHKSDSNLNGHTHKPNGHPDPPTSPPAPAAATVNAQTDTASDPTVNGSPPEGKMGVGISPPHGRLRAGSEGSLDDLEAHGAGSMLNGSPLRIDVKAVGKGAPHQQKGTLALAKTVIITCPLWDVVAMLILLLQLPPTIISIVHFLF